MSEYKIKNNKIKNNQIKNIERCIDELVIEITNEITNTLANNNNNDNNNDKLYNEILHKIQNSKNTKPHLKDIENILDNVFYIFNYLDMYDNNERDLNIKCSGKDIIQNGVNCILHLKQMGAVYLKNSVECLIKANTRPAIIRCIEDLKHFINVIVQYLYANEECKSLYMCKNYNTKLTNEAIECLSNTDQKNFHKCSKNLNLKFK